MEEKIAFCSGYITPVIFEIYKNGIWRGRNMPLPKHDTHYVPYGQVLLVMSREPPPST